MDELYKTYDRVTPAIKEMIQGKEVKTPHGIFRLELKGGKVLASDLAKTQVNN
jgi:hypothetical protein